MLIDHNGTLRGDSGGSKLAAILVQVAKKDTVKTYRKI